MAVTAYWYASAFIHIFTQPAGETMDFDTDPIKVMMTTNGYTPNQDTHRYKSDVTNEVAGTGYTAGGQALVGKAVAQAANVVTFDADNPQWAASTIANARRAVYYSDSGATDAEKPLLCWLDFGQDESTSAGTFTINHAATGIAGMTAVNAPGFP